MSETGRKSSRTILMWGDTATGKSSLIAAALYSPKNELPAIDMARTGRSANGARLHELWGDLRVGRPGKATAADEIDIELHRKDNTPVLLKDVRGGLVGQLAEQQVEQIVQSANVILFVMDFQTRNAMQQLDAIDGIWNICRNVAKALVFTKCELHLSTDHKAWKAERDWWRDFHDLRMLCSRIERFEDAVFPTSVYGYDPDSMFAAATLGEFGELRPFRITPRHVARPFAWALQQVDLHGEA